MAHGAKLPSRFPCWCRAVYSWGGETDKDLGFIEGDLIECLNAGDGSWWVGRLRRDKRMVGSFPSNFVVVLGDSYQPQPISRAASPAPPPPQNSETVKSQLPEKKKWAPFAGYKNTQTSSRAPSPAPPSSQPTYDPANPPSTVLWHQGPHSRGPSRSPSPLPQHDSPPPPPPLSPDQCDWDSRPNTLTTTSTASRRLFLAHTIATTLIVKWSHSSNATKCNG